MEVLAPEERRPKILVVDDDRGTAELIQMMLRARGYEVSVLESGSEAIETLEAMVRESSRWRDFPVDLVLLDIMMPGVDGFKVCQTLKESEFLKHIPVIMVTALDAASDKVAAVEFGADDYITKPFLPEELHAAIKAKLQVKDRESALLRKNVELETINEVGAAAGSTLDPRRVAEQALAALTEKTDFAGAVYVLDEEKGQLVRVSQVGVVRPERLPADNGFSAQLLRSPQPLLKADLASDPDLPSSELGRANLRSFVGVPLYAGEGALGVLEVYHDEPYSLDEGVLPFFQEVGARIGMALQNAEIFQRAQMLLLESSTLNVGGV